MADLSISLDVITCSLVLRSSKSHKCSICLGTRIEYGIGLVHGKTTLTSQYTPCARYRCHAEKRITKQDSQGDTTGGWLDLSLDVNIRVLL
ncbi:hypothetical protein TNCV_392471 [Trichonephila clavipes]|nr:hypothetical protein TNCV_392471 [Trichonephila clavipes]